MYEDKTNRFFHCLGDIYVESPRMHGKQEKSIKHFKSDIIGIKRKVTLYDCNGNVIRNWEGRFKIEIQGSYISFIDDNGKDIKVSGTLVVEET